MKVASTYSKSAKNSSQGGRPRQSASVKPAAMAERQDLYQMADEDYHERPMHLVPCRWRRDGWKYVESDPSRHNFFNNPNRINSVGMSPTMKDKIMERYAKRGNPQQTPTYFKDDNRFLDT